MSEKQQRSSRARPKPVEPTEAYRPTPREQTQVEKFGALERALGKLPLLKITKDEALPSSFRTDFDHPDQAVAAALMAAAIGTGRLDTLAGIIQRAINLTALDGKPHAGRANEFLATIASVQPGDGVENMMAVQMAVVQQALLGQAQRLRGDLSIEQHEMHANMINKLARTFAGQVDTLKRYRSKGDQRVTVVHEHKHVHLHNEAAPEGGGGGPDEIEGQSHERDERLLSAERAAVLGFIEADGLPVQGAGIDGQERVPLPRGQGGSPKGER